MKMPDKWEPMKGGLPLAALVGGLLLARGMSRSTRSGIDLANAKHNLARAGEANRNAQVNTTLRGGIPLDPSGSYLYNNERDDSARAGDMSMFDKGASAAGIEAGKLLAKSAGIGLPVPGILGKAAIGAGLIGAGVLAAKGAKKAGEFGMAPPQEKRLGGHAAGLPSYVNQYGVPVVGH